MSSSEDQSSSDECSDPKAKLTSSKNDSYFKNEIENVGNKKSLKKCPPLLTVEDLTSPDWDAWIVTTPVRLDAEKLHKLKFSLSKPTKLNIENENYEALIQNTSVKNTFLLPDENGVVKTVTREMMGVISFVKDLELKTSKNETTTNLPTKKDVCPPTGLKRRHPLYGDELEDLLAKARGERPKAAQTKQKKTLKKPKEEILEDDQHKVKGKKKSKLNN